MNIKWGLDVTDTPQVMDERVQYVGKPIKNLVNGFIDYETEYDFK